MLTKHFKPWLITIVLAMVLLSNASDVSGQQEPIYINDEQPTAATSTPPLEIVETLDTSSTEYIVKRILETFPEAPIMVNVARCESGLNPSADRANLGVDVGLFQINQVHLVTLNRLGLDRWDLEDNLTYARMLFDNAGLRDWYMSKHCWEQFL